MTKTQDECRKDFIISMRDFAERLDEINADTPAKGPNQDEPYWWLKMMEIRRSLREAEKFL
jgi:hypothetical protein